MSKSSYDTDEFLILRIRSGDHSALDQLVKNWHRLFCEKAYWMVKDKDASKDIAQESWTKILKNIDNLENPKRFKYWAYRIVCNNATDWLRKHSKNENTRGTYSEELSSDDLGTISERDHLKKSLIETIDTLPESQRTIINLFYIDNYSLRQISELLDISIGTVKSRLFHAREKLKKHFKNIYYEN